MYGWPSTPLSMSNRVGFSTRLTISRCVVL